MKPEILNPMITRFLILSNARSGTMMLTDSLDESSAVTMFNLYAANVDKPHQYWINWELFQQKCLPKVTHVGTTMHRVGNGWIKRFKHIQVEKFWGEMQDHHEKVICLHRENVLRQFLSRKVGIVLKSYKVDKPRKEQPGPVQIDVEELERFAQDLEQLQDSIDYQFPGRLTVTYEQLADQWQETFRRVQVYLGLPVSAIGPVTVRQETRPLQEAIQNYSEVSTHLIANGSGQWLD